MTEQSQNSRNISSLLDALPQAQLAEVSRRAALGGLKTVCHQELGGRSLDDVVATLFPDFPQARVAKVAREIGLTAIKNGCWKSIMSLPRQEKVEIHCPEREAARAVRAHQGPLILAFWHFGPVNMFPFGLKRIGVPAMVISRALPSLWTAGALPPDMRLMVNADRPKQGVVALRRAIVHLKRGGVVALAVDGSAGTQNIVVPFLGRQFTVSRGLAGLARLTGAPIIPCTMQWGSAGWSMAIRIFDPLPKPSAPPEEAEAFEQAILSSAARCFESFGRAHPGQFKIDQLARIVNAPRFDL